MKISEIVSQPTNNIHTWKNIPKLTNKPEYEGSEAKETDLSRFQKETEHTKYK